MSKVDKSLSAIKNRIMFASRENKINQFYNLCSGTEKILDVGVSSERKAAVAASNYFLRTFRLAPEQYTGLAIQNMDGMDRLFPGKQFVQYDGEKFPFDDKSYNMVFSNAVIEHVGDEARQLLFLKEILRVGNIIFFTTPNKFFPIETHTSVPFLHWNNTLFYAWCKKFRPFFNQDTLYLFSYDRLEKILMLSGCAFYKIIPNRFFGIPMTYSV
ncbi:class I SAM-dependent methyltransferase [Nitrosomonas sp.]|uniref:class I SAM-dependent methyltransferase n=1 Tax=Nitrosomonas sp. TaxID=42353 RepID=UPI00374CD05F